VDRRLHRSAIGAEALDGLRQLALPILVVAVLGGGFSSGGLARAVGFGVLGLAFSVAVAYVQWQTTRWRIDADDVRLRRGVFSETIVTIPLERVQAIDTVRGPIQRLFGSVELHVQSAGGGKAGEIVLKAVTPAEAEELREAVRVAGAGPSAPGDALLAPERPVAPVPEPVTARWRLRPGPLVVAALTSGSFGVLVPVVAGASQVVDDVLGAEDAQRLLPDTLGEAALLGGAVLAAAWVLSVLGTLVAFFGFAVRREGERLRIRRGVIERREASVPVARIHAVRIVESPLREPFGLATVRVETAGYADEPATAQTLLPLVRRAEVPAVLASLVPELEVPSFDDLAPAPPRALRRALFGPVTDALIAGAVLTLLFGTTGALGFLLVLPAAAYGVARHRATGWRLAGDRVVLRSRALARTTAIADARRLQSVAASASVLQRRVRLGTLWIAVSSGRRFAAEDLDSATVDDLLARLGAAATASPAPGARASAGAG
jgi:putative membrane protein